jgi:type IV secretory pathway VirB2 component (pilin)
MQSITSLFGSLALLAIVTAGFTLMFAPAAGRQMLKNTVIAIGLFMLSSMLLQSCCTGTPRKESKL